MNDASTQIKAYGASGSVLSKLKPMDIERHAPKEDEVGIDILYCGVCHSDVHQVKNDWDNTVYPCVPGHEIIGRVKAVGSRVKRFKENDIVGVGCMIDSCGECRGCKEGLEQYCEGPKGWTATYNGPMEPDGTNTFGGYSESITVKERFVLKIPDNLDPKSAGPILCAGVTTYSPLKHWKIKSGSKIAVVGIGGLGHMAIKLAKAMGAHVTAITATEGKKEEGLRLGADAVLLSTDKDAISEHELSFDFILNTIPDEYDVNPYATLLKRDGTHVAAGVIGPFKGPTDNSEIVMHRRSLAGTLIGGIAETQEVLDFCAEHGIAPDVEMIRIQDINKAFERLLEGDVRYRFVIDMQSLKENK